MQTKHSDSPCNIMVWASRFIRVISGLLVQLTHGISGLSVTEIKLYRSWRHAPAILCRPWLITDCGRCWNYITEDTLL